MSAASSSRTLSCRLLNPEVAVPRIIFDIYNPEWPSFYKYMSAVINNTQGNTPALHIPCCAGWIQTSLSRMDAAASGSISEEDDCNIFLVDSEYLSLVCTRLIGLCHWEAIKVIISIYPQYYAIIDKDYTYVKKYRAYHWYCPSDVNKNKPCRIRKAMYIFR